MKDKITNAKNIKYYIFSILGLILLITGLSLGISDYLLEQRAINISATIKTIDYNANNRKATIEYKVENKKYSKVINLKDDQELTVKDNIMIKYDKNNPNNLINNDHIIFITLCIVSSVIFLLLGLNTTFKLLKKQKNIKYLIKNGLYIECSISEIILNNTVKSYRGTYPYKIRCKYINPIDTKEYTFESDNTYINLQKVINEYGNKTILVYIDKENTSNYHVDLSSLYPKIKIIDPKELMKSELKQETSQTEGNEITKDEKTETQG